MGKISAFKSIIAANKVGAGMSSRFSRFVKKSDLRGIRIEGTKQVLNGKQVVQGERIHLYEGRAYGERETFTRITTQTPNGTRTVSRQVPANSSGSPLYTFDNDVTKITDVANAQVGGLRVNTTNRQIAQYYCSGLLTQNAQIDRVFAGRHHLGGRFQCSEFTSNGGKYKYKQFFGPDGKVLKTIHYDSQTGLRAYAELPNGQRIMYDSHGLPLFTDAKTGEALNLGGLENLI